MQRRTLGLSIALTFRVAFPFGVGPGPIFTADPSLPDPLADAEPQLVAHHTGFSFAVGPLDGFS